MSGLHLTVTTPMTLLADVPEVRSVRAEDESGAFGILPGHANLLTVLPVSVLRWREADGTQRFCALRAGLLTVTGGERVSVACREGVLGDNLSALETRVRKLHAEEQEEERHERTEEMRLHANAVRELLRYLHPGRPNGLSHPPRIASGPGGAA